MQTHQLQPKHTSRSRKIVGRGGKKGTYSGRGGKGQTARSGRKLAPVIRELIKRYPKLKGYRAFVLPNAFAVVNLVLLEKHFVAGDLVSPETLAKKKLIAIQKGKNPKVKILGTGELTKKLVFENCKVSASAKAAIEKAGGTLRQAQGKP
ncbi:MAG: 50S ribosomal protein L15 [Candidatus Staskawiczbacteria bacterium RIFCSPHIGHO2_02_FULL_43_16]|nr:MAG: 50S ribosomal protein L15 [Candidatus Staskawiczbacteria bacterium RIFCSPHIGHO2_02_FULL_43_16]OGZ74661.1 MAG: 50S ribosomal protein L15 [Candidatus Staskawiczbacteria bacterium RIFCSPLOWO2_01_FULL_43_17b]